MKIQIGDYEVSVKAKYRNNREDKTLVFLNEIAMCYYATMEMYEKTEYKALANYYRKAANNLHAICEKAGLYK